MNFKDVDLSVIFFHIQNIDMFEWNRQMIVTYGGTFGLTDCAILIISCHDKSNKREEDENERGD